MAIFPNFVAPNGSTRQALWSTESDTSTDGALMRLLAVEDLSSRYISAEGEFDVAIHILPFLLLKEEKFPGVVSVVLRICMADITRIKAPFFLYLSFLA